MSAKNTLIWLLVAGTLFGFIYFYEQRKPVRTTDPGKVLPDFRADEVSSIQIRPSGPAQLLIRVDRTNRTWQLTQPLVYPAHNRSVSNLLAFLEQLTPAPYITGKELQTHTNADEEFGFGAPLATVVIQQGGLARRMRVGALTNPGDQVFLQLEGDLGAYVVDAGLLRLLPRSADDWRDRTLLQVTNLVFDHLAVTNNAKGEPGRGGLPASSSTFVLQRDSTNRLWRMTWPLDSRANQSKILEALEKLQNIRIAQFISDDPKIDLEPFGLAPAELELGFSSGTNGLALLQFGRSLTNDLTRVYARRVGEPGIFAVDKELLLGWCSFLNDFRDPHLLSLADPVDSIELAVGSERSSLRRAADGKWLILPGDLPADPDSVSAFVFTLTNLQIREFVNDVANPADLPQYGLAPPFERLILTSVCAGSSFGSNNTAVAELDFGRGTNSADQIFARRTDESFVYAILSNDFVHLPTASWQLRDRKLCSFALEEVSALTLKARGKTCRMLHKGSLSWSFAPGSQGLINDGAVEETIRSVIRLAAITWAGHGAQTRSQFGFVDDGYHLILELKSGATFDLELGGEAPSGNAYAGVTLEGEFWVLEFPWMLYRDLDAYFPIKPGR